ncbi:MAG: choice-of-anchor Q domain-containing protein, partial [Candidatus Methylacidiphilales bacterium]
VWTIVGKTGARSFTIDRALTIDGSSQPRVTGIGNAIAVNGIGFLNNFASVFYINTPSPSAQVNLNNLLITGGKGTLDTGVLRGGGVNIFTGTATITDSTISQNSAIYGGGIDVKVTNGRLNLTRSTIERNTASSFGGGIFNQGTSTVTNSTLSGNIANQGGGINNNSGGAITIISSTISENFSSTYGGGIINFGTLTLQSTIVAGNASGFNPDVSGFVDYTSDYNLIGDSTGSSGWHPSLQNLLGTSGTPINPLLSALGDYGGITRTYALLVGSPALNAGAPTTTALDTDQRGMSRVGGARMDIGAYEAQTSYVVRNTGDYVSTGARVEHSLRAALAYYGLQPVNGAEKPASITFNISTSDPGYNPVTGVWTIRGASGATSFTINRALTIDGASQPRTIAGTTPVISIDASRFLTGFASVIRVVAGSTDDIVLNNLNLTGGKGTDLGGGTIGGGISNVNGRLSITNSTISGNEALLGGGIVNTASLSLTNTTVTGNSSTQGGGINANNGGTLTIANSTITRNSADIGGGIISLGILTIAESSLTRNWGNVGGGAYVFSGTTSLDKVTVAGNKTIAQGGGIFLNNATLNITNSTFSGNTATDGGGIHQNTGTLTVTNSTLSGNTATGIGGGLRQNAGTTTITSSTITENSAGNGGGINSSAGTLTLTSAIVARNIATTAPDVSGTVSATSDYNLIGDATGAGGSFEWSGNHNILLDPSSPTWLTDIGLAPLGNYGGPTQTHALLPGSLALNARPTLPGDLATDQRGLPRNVDGLVDIGAFESSGFTYTITSGNPSTQILSPFAPVQITVTANNPLEAVNGGAVTLIVPITPGTASATGTLTRTITGGVASFSDLIANDIFGSYAVGVRNAPGTSFTFTNTGIALIIAADGTFQIYGDADPLTYRLAGGTLLGSDILSAIFTGNLSHGNNPNAGVYDITIGTLALNAYGQSRYTFTFSDTADFTIAPRPLAVTPDSGQSKTFGETDPSPFLYTITGGSLLTGDSLTGALSRVSGEDPGFYLFLLGTLGNPNYALTLNGVPSAQFAILADNTPPAPPAPPAPPTPPKPPEPPTLRTISFADPNTLWFYIAPKSPIGHSGVIYYAPPPPETTGALEHGSSFKLFSGEASEVDPVR